MNLICKRRKLDTGPLTEQEFHELATYNSEVGRLVHTDSWKAKMAVLQERWDRCYYADGSNQIRP